MSELTVPTENFFEESREASAVKSEIVVKYLLAWGLVMTSQTQGKLLYFDPFAGPGVYGDGSKSTPLRVLDAAIAEERLARQLKIIFGDRDTQFCQQLTAHVQSTPGVEILANQPSVVCDDVDQDLTALLTNTDLVPTFAFLDPWGYKGLTLDLVNSLLRNWGCDCLFFFNYNRINAGLSNPKVDEHVTALFGAERARHLREEVAGLSPDAREVIVMGALREALQDGAGDHVHFFKFMSPDGRRTSHYLVFASKHFRGYEIFKDITAKASSYDEDSVPSYTYTPIPHQAVLDECMVMVGLKDDLVRRFAGRTMTVRSIYEEDSPGKRFLSRNYKRALRELETENRIMADPSEAKRKKNTMADSTLIAFPDKPKEAACG